MSRGYDGLVQGSCRRRRQSRRLAEIEPQDPRSRCRSRLTVSHRAYCLCSGRLGCSTSCLSRACISRSPAQHRPPLRDFTKALELNPENAGALKWRAYAYYRNEDFDEALTDCDRYLELKPHSTLMKEFRMSTLAELGKVRGIKLPQMKLRDGTITVE